MGDAAASSVSQNRRALQILLAVSMLGVVLVLRPFWAAFFLAAVFAASLWPLHRALSRVLRGRHKTAAAALIIAVTIVTLAPLVTLSAVIVKETAEATRFVTETVRSEGVLALIARLPQPLEKAVRQLLELVPGEAEGEATGAIQEQVSARGGKAAAVVGKAVVATGSLLIQALMMLIALFFFLTEKEAILAWIDRNSPLVPRQTRELLDEFRRVSVGVLRSTVLTAAVQTVVALVGYLIAGVPYTLFFTAVTFFVAMIPAVGAASVGLLCAGLLLVTAHVGSAIFLALWSVVAVGLSDNVVKPWLLKGDVGMHGALVFFALLGGLAAFGTIGLLLGPLGVAFFIAVLRIYRRDYRVGADA